MYIVSNKWLRGGYAKLLRELGGGKHTVETLVDFGHAPIFPDADAFPCIVVVRKEAPPDEHDIRVTQYPRGELGRDLLAGYVDTHSFPVPQRDLDSAGWSLDPPGARGLLTKLRTNGVPLGEYLGSKPYSGVKTGCNEAFLIDQALKDQLCRQDPGSSEILKKYLRGQDVGRWAPVWAGQWMIFARRGIDIDRYPAVKRHLETFRTALEPKPKGWSGQIWPGRKQGAYKWYELQDSVDYHEAFARPKLLFQDIQFYPSFVFDELGLYPNNTAYALDTEDFWVLGVLNSPAMWWHNWRHLVHAKDEALRAVSAKMVHVPIPSPSAAQRDAMGAAVATAVRCTAGSGDAVAAVLDVLRIEYGVERPGQALRDFASLSSDGFAKRVSKRRRKGVGRLSPVGLRELRELHEAESPPILELRARLREAEQTIARTAHEAWKLTPHDLVEMRATAPPRMPPGLDLPARADSGSD